jgi:acetyl esterase/lipase
MSRRTLLAALTNVTALMAAACSHAAFVAVNVPASFGAYTRRTNLAYGPDPKHRLDVYLPDKRTPAPRPLIIFWHGGRWRWGNKAQYRFVGAALAELGCVTVVPNYRLYPHVLMAGFMEDATRAAGWAADHAGELGADPDRLYLMGHSAGAYLAALLALDLRYFAAAGRPAPRIAGVIGLSGAYDFLPLLEPDVQEMFGPPARYPDSQPINFVRPDAPPMLLVHGLSDATVWPKNSRNLASALSALTVAVSLKLYPKVMHAGTVAALSIPARGHAPTLADIAAFIQSNERSQAPLRSQAALEASASRSA